MNQIKDYILPIAVPIATFILGILGRYWITPSEKQKQEADLLKSYAEIIASHTETISLLQATITNLLTRQNDLEKRIVELETENQNLNSLVIKLKK